MVLPSGTGYHIPLFPVPAPGNGHYQVAAGLPGLQINVPAPVCHSLSLSVSAGSIAGHVQGHTIQRLTAELYLQVDFIPNPPLLPYYRYYFLYRP